MAILFTDGFDNYGTTTGTTINTRWAAVNNTTPNTTITPWGYGQSIRLANLTCASVNFTDTSTVTVGMAVYVTAAASVTTQFPMFGLLSGSTWQFGLWLLADGGIQVARMTSSTGATVIVPSNTSTGAMSFNKWHYMEVSVTISDTVGTVTISVDGKTVVNATGLDTRNGTPTTVNNLTLGQNYNSDIYVDDLYITDNLTQLGPQRIYTLMPNADTAQKQWTSSAGWQPTKTTSIDAGGYATRGNIFTANANTALKGVQVYLGAVAQTVVLGIAQLSSLNPGAVSTILYQSSPVVRTAVAGYQSFTFPDVALTSGNIYAVYITRTDGTSTSNSSLAYNAAIDNLDPNGLLTLSAYIFKADNNIIVSDTLYAAVGGGYNMILNYSGASNYLAVNDPYDTDADTSYVTASSVGNYDLYDVQNYPSANANIKAVNQIVWARKTDAATRTMNLTTKSGATTTDSTAVTLGASYAGYSRIYETDPNTASAWSVSGVNALQIGQKVAS